MKASVIIILVAQALFTTAAAAVAARASVDEILIRADPSPYRPAHGNIYQGQVPMIFVARSLGGLVFKKLIVNYDSAKLGLPGEVCRSLNTDHQGMGKFNSPQDSDYKAVLGALGYLVSSFEQECEH
ncbi:hypothetical protein MY3296_006327 [Beauveria thailandica]